MEHPDVVFSVKQIHCDQSEANSPALTPADSGISLKSDSDPETPGKVENVGSSPGNAAELFLELKEKPEELLQLAPEAGDVVPMTGKTLQRLVGFWIFIQSVVSSQKRIMFYFMVYLIGRLSPPSGNDEYYTNTIGARIVICRLKHKWPLKSSANNHKGTSEMD